MTPKEKANHLLLRLRDYTEFDIDANTCIYIILSEYLLTIGNDINYQYWREVHKEIKNNIDLFYDNSSLKERVMDDLFELQHKVDKMGFKGQNEHDLFVRDEISDYILKILRDDRKARR